LDLLGLLWNALRVPIAVRFDARRKNNVSYSQAAPPSHGSSPAPAAVEQVTRRAVKRSAALTALIVASLMSALCAVIGAVIVFSGGTGLADSNVKDVLRNHPDVVGVPAGMSPDEVTKSLAGPLWQQLVDDRASTLSSRAGIAVFVAVCMLIFAFFARRATVWSRVMLSISSLACILPCYLVVTDYEPASVTALSWVTLLFGVAAVALCWVPGVSRHGKERGAAR
jgi:hypothetical protein